MIAPMNSLMNMEMALYGGLNTNASAPSYLNGYVGESSIFNEQNLYNPNFYGYNQNFGQVLPTGYANQVQNQQNGVNNQNQQNPLMTQPVQTQQVLPFQGLTENDRKAIVDYYAKNLEPSESLLNAATTGAIGTVVMTNPRIIAHPINYLKTTFSPKSQVNAMFKDAKKAGTALNAAWKENSMIMEEAFSQMHRAEARFNSKAGLFRKSYSKQDFAQLKTIMETALTPGADGKININKVAEATEKLRHAYSNNGWLFDPIGNFKERFGKFANKFGIKKGTKTVASQLNDVDIDKIIKSNTDKLLELNRGKATTFKNAFQKAGGKMGLAFGALEFLMSYDKIQTAFEKDKKTGWKQVGQSAVKSAANAGGWMLGETAAIWAGAKLGATIGTAFGPGVGTAIGAVIGFIGGSIGMCLAGKAAKALVGEDVANKINADKLAQSSDGQLEILQNVLETAQKDENLDAKTAIALNKTLNMYA